MENTREIILLGKKFLLIDLTHPLILETQVYPGDPKLERKVFSSIGDGGWHHYMHVMGDHIFQPHIDAPNHQNSDLQDKGVEVYGNEFFYNSATMIDLSNIPEAQNFNGIKYLVKVEKRHLESLEHRIKRAGALLIRTGYDGWLEENRKHVPENLPYLTKEAAEYLASFENLNVIGIDSLTVDPVGEHVAHQALKNKMIVESLVHLHEIPYDAYEFDLQTTPIKIEGATGGPVVVHAYVAL